MNRYDTDGNGYVDHQEFLAKLGGELAPGDVHGHSTVIAEQSQHVMESMYKKQQVSAYVLALGCGSGTKGGENLQRKGEKRDSQGSENRGCFPFCQNFRFEIPGIFRVKRKGFFHAGETLAI